MVGQYKFNYLLDSLRLIRGVFASSAVDPFIQSNPLSISARNRLFQWSMIPQESGDYDKQYPSYSPYQSSQLLLMEHLPERYGRDAFTHLMDAKPSRIQQITNLLESQGVEVNASDESWLHILDWLSEQWAPSKEPVAVVHSDKRFGEIRTRPICYSFLHDVALLLGEHAIEKRPDYQWAFWGDVAVDNPAGFGRSPWVLCEPIPFQDKIPEAPKRFLPIELVRGSVVSMRTRNTRVTEFFSSLCEV